MPGAALDFRDGKTGQPSIHERSCRPVNERNPTRSNALAAQQLRQLGDIRRHPPRLGRMYAGPTLMLSVLGQFDQSLEGITIVFKGVFNALWHVIWHASACYAGKLQHVIIHQIPTRPFEGIIAAVFIDALQFI